ncbi:MAG: bifunctional folylpolyglutamate synthase/dihydrofolate synthase [Arenicellales bacterium]
MRPNTGSSLDEWTTYIQSIHFRSIDLSLDRPRRVLHRMRLPRPSTVIVVGGTNGKGTTVRLLETVYRSAGYSVGCYTSPHLISYTERVRLNDEDVEAAALCRAFSAVDMARQEIPLTYFEFGTLAAFKLMADSNIQVAILEVGMGGRLDAVNLMSADLAVITSVELDHQAWLGTTRERIGAEKAGIFRYQSKAVVADPNPPKSVKERLKQLRCDALISGEDYTLKSEPGSGWSWAPSTPRADDWALKKGTDLPQSWILGSCSAVRAANLSGALACLYHLSDRLVVKQKHVNAIFSAALPGRRERIDGAIPIWLDVAHNPHAVAGLRDELTVEPVTGVTRAVFAMLADKDVEACVELLQGVVDEWSLCSLEDDRALSIAALEARMPRGCVVRHSAGVKPWEVFSEVISNSKPGDRVVAFGSFYLVGDILESLRTGVTS